MPLLEHDTIELELTGQTATENLAGRLSALARTGDVFALKGDLGTGKTVFARAFVRALTRPDTEVPSPTFTLVQSYNTEAGLLHHFDLYRLEHAEEALELGLDEAFADGISLIEWPERLGSLLPPDGLILTLAYGEGEQNRTLQIDATGHWVRRLQEAGFAD